MTIALNGTPGSITQTAPVSSPITVTCTIPANSTLCIELTDNEGSALVVTSVTSQTVVQRASKTHAGVGTQRSQIFTTSAGGAASATSCVINFTGVPLAISASVTTYSGVLGIGNAGSADSGAGSSANPTVAATTQDANNMVVASVGTWVNVAITNGSATVETGSGGTGATDIWGGAADELIANPGTKNVSTTLVSNEWVATWVELRSTSITISAHPTDKTVLVGDTANFTITASGTGTLHYQWKVNGNNVGTDSNSYTTDAAVASDNASIVTCVVTDDLSTLTSNGAYWFVTGSAPLWLTKA